MTQIAAIPTLFGASHPILNPRSDWPRSALQATPIVVFVPCEACCYLTNSLEGGP